MIKLLPRTVPKRGDVSENGKEEEEKKAIKPNLGPETRGRRGNKPSTKHVRSIVESPSRKFDRDNFRANGKKERENEIGPCHSAGEGCYQG